jgi:peptidoglycan/xylan/chitin deacetylase (PgdA/CDA1 family)
MRMKKIVILCILMSCMIQTINAQLPGGICNWYEDKKAATVLTFDDWSPGHYPIVVPELKNRNINGTFFVMLKSIASWNHPWPDLVVTANDGNEIANHTENHPNLTTQSASQLHTEIRTMRDLINQNITTQKVSTFAYPFGAYNAQILDTVKACGHIGARGTNPSSGNYSYNFAPNNDSYYNVLTYAMDGTISTKAFYTEIKNTIQGGGLITFLYHSIDNAAGTYTDNWYSKVLQDSLKKQLDTLVYVKDKVWITTFSKAIKYHREKNCATLSQTQAPDGTTWVLDMTDTLSDYNLYNQALTIKLKMNGVNYTTVSQNATSLTIVSTANDSITFHAIPDRGPIILSTNGTMAPAFVTAVNEQLAGVKEDMQISPVPANGMVTITTTTAYPESSLSIRNAMGKEVYATSMNNISNLSVDLSGYAKGIYYVSMKQPQTTITKKIVVVD